jgi:hypothetical protein
LAATADVRQVSRNVGSEPVTFRLPPDFNPDNYYLYIGGLDPFGETAMGGVVCARRGVTVLLRRRRVTTVRVVRAPVRLTVRWIVEAPGGKELFNP